MEGAFDENLEKSRLDIDSDSLDRSKVGESTCALMVVLGRNPSLGRTIGSESPVLDALDKGMGPMSRKEGS